ncbi:MAG: hypothetical protein K6C37_07100 [Bacteroidales bacterium]|nr:hypothetical protein [Bacteroidales bacterium]
MKNIFKSILALTSLAFIASSCDVENVGNKFNPGDEQKTVSFVQKVVSDTELSADLASYDIMLGRNSAEAALTCELKTDLPGNVCPTSVSFAAGQYEAPITIDLSGLPVGKLLKGSIEVLDQVSYASSKINVSLQKAYVWEPYGTVKITDDLVTAVFGVENVTWQVEAMKAAGFEVYRLLDPYGAAYPYNEPGDFEEGAKWDINATNPDNVVFERTYLGFNWGYGEFNVFLIDSAVGGKMQNKVITFPKNSIAFNLPDEGSWKANGSGLFKIDLNL